MLENNIDLNCVALYKVSKMRGETPPDERVHIYLAGIIDRFENPSLDNSQFIVNSVDDLNKTVLSAQNDAQPNALPYLVGKYSGDYSINYNAHLPLIFDSYFPSACYSVAQYHGNKMGKKEEATIFGLLALNPEKHISLLSSYYSFSNNEDFEITEEDFLSFKKELGKRFNSKKIFRIPKKTKILPNKKGLI